MILEIVTHCWQYSRVWSYQISSLILHAPRDLLITASIAYDPDDATTSDRLQWYRRYACDRHAELSFMLYPLPMMRARLWNRAVARNMRSKDNVADLVWFTDADYVFGPGCLATLRDKAPMILDAKPGTLFYPNTTLINVDHATGDRYALRATRPGIYDVDPADFHHEPVRRAIGGVQIVSGDTARKFGYCPQEKWQRPLDPERDAFGNFKSDREYRRQLGGKALPLALPNLYRIRQTQTGVVDTLEE